MVKLKAFRDMYKEDEIKGILGDSGTDFTIDIDFEAFLRVSNFMSLICSLLDNFFLAVNIAVKLGL